jgi:hypothetical protein
MYVERFEYSENGIESAAWLFSTLVLMALEAATSQGE